MGFRLDYLGFCLKLGQGMSLTWSLWFWFRIEENSSYMGTYLRGEVGLVGFIGWLGCYCAVFAAVFSLCIQVHSVLVVSGWLVCVFFCCGFLFVYTGTFGFGCIWVAGLCLLLARFGSGTTVTLYTCTCIHTYLECCCRALLAVVEQLQGLARSKLERSGAAMVLQEMDRAIIQGCLQAAEGGKLVQSIDGLHEFLVQHGLAWRQVIHCDHVGVHSQNRDGLGCSSAHVHDLLKSICSIGFSQSEVRGICLEVPHGPEGDEIRGFNQRLVSDAGGKLAPVTSLRYASVVGSHANQAARCIWHKVAHDDDRLTVDGKLSLEKLEAVDKAWARSIRDGHTWLVVSHELAREFPQYCLLAQAAGNAAGQIAAVEHEIQLAKRVNSSIQAFLSRSEKKTVTYQDISAEILRSRSPHASALPSIFGFVLKYGGGTEHDSFMARTERHVRAHGFPNRVLGGDMWHALSQDCKGPEQHVSWRHMLLKFGLCGPEKCLTLTDVKRSLSARDVLKSVGEAESFLLQVQKLGQDLDSDTIEASLGNLEVQLASIVLQKKKISQHDTLQDAARSCLEKIGVPCPWGVAASTSTATREPSTSHRGS